MTAVPVRWVRPARAATAGAVRRYGVSMFAWLFKQRRPVILTLTSMIGLTFLVVAAWTVSTAFGEFTAGACVLLLGWYFEVSTRPEDRV